MATHINMATRIKGTQEELNQKVKELRREGVIDYREDYEDERGYNSNIVVVLDEVEYFCKMLNGDVKYILVIDMKEGEE